MLAYRKKIQQRLAWVLVQPVARIYDRCVAVGRYKFRRARAAVAQHEDIGAHRLHISDGVDQRLALFRAAVRSGEIYAVCAQALGCDLKAGAGASGVFEKRVDDRLTAKRVGFFNVRAVELFKLAR